MPGRRLGSRRVPVGWAKSERQPCVGCGGLTHGLPAEGYTTFGPRTAEYVNYGHVWLCSRDDCLAHFDTLMDADVADQAAHKAHIAESTGNAHDGPMSDNNDHLGQMGRMAGSFAQQVLHETLHDGLSLYGRGRELVQRTVWGATYGILGGAVGTFFGFLVGSPSSRGEQPEDVKDVLLRRVKIAQAVRTIVPMAEQQFTTMEYEARKELEHLGYYPCEECGVPHVQDERHRMPPGTYWYEAESRYVRPDDPKWTEQGYEAAAGERWDLDDERDGGKVH